VEAVGEGVALAPGTRVVLSWLPWCGRCEECGRGLTHLCSEAWAGMFHGGLLDGTPRFSRNGAPVYHYSYLGTFAEHVVVPARCCVPIGDDVPFEIAALVGCAVMTGIGAVWNTARARPGDRIAVFGCGGVGLSAILGAAAAAASPVVAIDVSDEKLAGALELGASDAVPWAGSAEATAEAVREATGGGVDFAIEATGRPEAMLAAFLSTRPRGAAVLVGIARPDAVVPLPAGEIPRKERRILGSAYGSARPERDFPAILELYRRGRLPLDSLVSHRVPLDEVETAFDLLRSGAPRRVVVELDRT
jgi:Zn-dependent alcohol dehydrogenase